VNPCSVFECHVVFQNLDGRQGMSSRQREGEKAKNGLREFSVFQGSERKVRDGILVIYQEILITSCYFQAGQ
jgi:hypothetical protein